MDSKRLRAGAGLYSAYVAPEGWHVVAPDGLVWWPGEKALEEIQACRTPEARAVSICIFRTSQGRWAK